MHADRLEKKNAEWERPGWHLYPICAAAVMIFGGLKIRLPVQSP
jgi:hypothetical protein